ncbi:hypothetical protein AN958_00673 [Leucoagaricus sp. SymC.cos]|nr:hypothetical protein AN958_00673 [Leucoagaricus sp. SymC.cos]
MPHDSFIDPLVSRVSHLIGRKSKHDDKKKEPYYSGGGSNGPQEHSSASVISGSFNYAHDFVIQNATMTERAEYTFSNNNTVLGSLVPYTMPEAAMDSSARDPPPRCHPGTRVHIVSKLERLRDNPNRQWDMIWLHGPAGTGKSAVAQTFAELCAERNQLGAAFFFSRPNKRDRPEKVIPTLAFQLAFHCSAFKSIVTRVLANDPHLLKKAIHVQFRQLIVQPFSQLQDQHHESVRRPFLVILDGMDECDGEKAQRDFIKLIGDLVTVKRGFPILWLICSRPEPCLVHTFLRLPHCQREELVLDEHSRDDVEKFLRDRFQVLRDEYLDLMPTIWPDEEQLDIVLRFCSSLFAAASVVLGYVSDPASANPIARLNGLISFLQRREGMVGPSHPLISLDMLYTRVLSEIPEDLFPTTQRILSYLIYTALPIYRVDSCQTSLSIPAPEHAIDKKITFHHASFADFLRDSDRSGKFFIDEGKAYVDMAKTLLFWHDLDAGLFHATDGIRFNYDHEHDKPLPDAADDVCYMFAILEKLDVKDKDLLNQVQSQDFRYLRISNHTLCDVLKWVYKQDPSNTLVHKDPSSEVDFRLLDYLKIMTGGESVRPAVSYLIWVSHVVVVIDFWSELFIEVR